jgi:hypothetical protein
MELDSESASELEVLLFVFFSFLMFDVLFGLCFALLLYDTQGRLLDRESFRLLTFSYLRRSESDQTSQFDSKRFDLNVLERGVDCLFSLDYYSVQAFKFPSLHVVYSPIHRNPSHVCSSLSDHNVIYPLLQCKFRTSLKYMVLFFFNFAQSNTHYT